MADVKISGLPAASIPLNDTDIVPLVQNNVTSQAAVSDLTAGRAVSAASLAINSSSSSIALRVTQTGTGNALVVEDSANPDSTPFVVDANGRVITGYTSALNIPDGTSSTQRTPQSQLIGISSIGGTIQRWSADAASGFLSFGKSRSSTIGNFAVVSPNDDLGSIAFCGDDGTALIPAANILAEVDGTPGLNDMPGRLVFSTTADGAANPTERMRIKSTGQIRFVPQTEPATAQAGDVYYDLGTNKLRCYNGTIWNDLF